MTISDIERPPMLPGRDPAELPPCAIAQRDPSDPVAVAAVAAQTDQPADDEEAAVEAPVGERWTKDARYGGPAGWVRCHWECLFRLQPRFRLADLGDEEGLRRDIGNRVAYSQMWAVRRVFRVPPPPGWPR